MIDLTILREDPDAFQSGLERRGRFPQTAAQLLDLDRRSRAAQTAVQELQSERNRLSTEAGRAKREGNDGAFRDATDRLTRIKAELPAREGTAARLAELVKETFEIIPNLLAPDVPTGLSEAENVEVIRSGSPRPGGPTQSHDALGTALGMMDFEGAVKLSGSRYTVLSGPLARLERVLGQFMIDTHVTENGYREMATPCIVNPSALYGTGQLPKFQDDLFALNGAAQYLIPTAEVTLTNLVAGTITAPERLPLRMVALTPCFRSEAGSAGRDTRGMLRQHQFNKVELVAITQPEDSDAEHERMLGAAVGILERLDLPHRVVKLCSGDTGFSARRTYDIEVWLPSQDRYREISSVSTCGDFQARRMGARTRDAHGKTRLVHTLNGSGVAVGRALIAVMENYQNADGSITVPEVLRPLMGGIEAIR